MGKTSAFRLNQQHLANLDEVSSQLERVLGFPPSRTDCIRFAIRQLHLTLDDLFSVEGTVVKSCINCGRITAAKVDQLHPSICLICPTCSRADRRGGES